MEYVKVLQKCPECQTDYILEIKVDSDRVDEDMINRLTYDQVVAKCLVVDYPSNQTETTETISNAIAAMRQMETDMLKMIVDFEEKYGIAIQTIETNLTGIPAYYVGKGMRTNSISIYGEI